MAEGRKALVQLPPLGLTEEAATFNAYSGRRGLVGVAETLEPKLDISGCHALGNFRQKGMPSHYSLTKLVESF